MVSDGEAQGQGLGSETPVFTLRVQSARPDAAVHEASAVRFGETVFVRALVSVDAEIDIGKSEW